MTWQDALSAELQTWIGTPWMAGQCMRGRGVDCRFFVVGVLDTLYGITEPLPPRLSQDLSLHDRHAAVVAAASIARRYPHERIDPSEATCGDVVVTRRGAGPGHVMILDPFESVVAWHSTSPIGVCRTSLATFNGLVEHVWRPVNKAVW